MKLHQWLWSPMGEAQASLFALLVFVVGGLTAAVYGIAGSKVRALLALVGLLTMLFLLVCPGINLLWLIVGRIGTWYLFLWLVARWWDKYLSPWLNAPK